MGGGESATRQARKSNLQLHYTEYLLSDITEEDHLVSLLFGAVRTGTIELLGKTDRRDPIAGITGECTVHIVHTVGAASLPVPNPDRTLPAGSRRVARIPVLSVPPHTLGALGLPARTQRSAAPPPYSSALAFSVPAGLPRLNRPSRLRAALLEHQCSLAIDEARERPGPSNDDRDSLTSSLPNKRKEPF